MFTPLPEKPGHDNLEHGILKFWEREQIFLQLRTKNEAGPRFSFIDGPVTANKVLGVHTAWGRTLKDVFQRYKALRGFHQRYQNGFDCQGLWIEVMVERQLGLNSKKEIEEFGLEEFARKCRDVVVWSAGELTKGSIRLGQWMDWGRDYFTSSDTNIEYIWRFLRIVHERGWLYKGHRPTEWCPRCGTSISAHELVGSYVDKSDPSLLVRLPLRDRQGEALVVWTTTPWTLPANVAAAVNPDAQYGRLPNGDWVATARFLGRDFAEIRAGRELVGWRYEGPFDNLGPGAKVEHRVIPWQDVSLEEGSGIVHIAPGCGAEDFELGRVHGLPVLGPVNEAGEFLPEYGWLSGLSTVAAADQLIEDLKKRDRLAEASTIVHRYPECWRCHTPLIFRVSDDWFIAVDQIREPLREANRAIEWIPDYAGKRMDDWLANMGDWNISRRRYYGLPLPFYPCKCGHLNVIGSRAELEQRATRRVQDLPELHRPWIDRIQIRCEACGEGVARIPEVGDVWLDAGIVPFSTLGWQNPQWVLGGNGTGAAKGLTSADLPDHSYWEQWFPADWVSEMYEQVRLWFYSVLFMSVALTGRSAYKTVLTYQKLLDERGREMHGSWGNLIQAEEAFARMGADVMRWVYCMQPPTQNIPFGFGIGRDIQRKLLILWNCAKFFVEYANIAGFTPNLDDLTTGPQGELRTLDRWLIARTHKLLLDSTRAYEMYLTMDVLHSFEEFVDDVSTWYIRRSRRRFWGDDRAALQTLWYALVQGSRVIGSIMPFMAEYLWQTLVRGPLPQAPRSLFLAGWPDEHPIGGELLADMNMVRRVVELGRRIRVESRLRLRQPLRRLTVDGASRAEPYSDEIADELRVKEVVFQPVDATQLRIRPNLRVLGPRLGAELQVVRKALEAGEFVELPGGGIRVAGHDLGPDDVLIDRVARKGVAVASEDGVTVALDTTLDEQLRREGRIYDCIHLVNTMRKEAGLELTDRIRLTLPSSDADMLEFADWLKAETLSVSLEVGPGDHVKIERVAVP